MTERAERLGRVIEALVLWARVLDSRELFPIGGERLSRQQAEVLFLLAHSNDPVTPGMLAERLHVTKGAVTQLVSGLIAAGLAAQSPDAADGRKRVLELTDAARATIGQFEGQVVAQLAQRFDGLDDDQLAQLADLLACTTEAP